MTSFHKHPRRLLTKIVKPYFRTIPGRVMIKVWPNLVRNHIRKWCVDEEIVVRTSLGFQLAVSPHDYISYGIYFFGEYDSSMSSVLTHHLRCGHTAWDVGTERGWFTLLMAYLVGPTGQVDSFEAFPPNFKKLQANIDLNLMSWVNLNEVAVSEANGTMWFVPPSDEVTKGAKALEHCGGVGYLTNTYQPNTIKVPTIKLDDYAEQVKCQNLDLIKIDIEGAEVSALRGAINIIRTARPIIAIEYNSDTASRAGTSVDELDDLLDSYGYDRFVFENRFLRLDLADRLRKTDHELVLNVYCFPRASG